MLGRNNMYEIKKNIFFTNITFESFYYFNTWAQILISLYITLYNVQIAYYNYQQFHAPSNSQSELHQNLYDIALRKKK